MPLGVPRFVLNLQSYPCLTFIVDTICGRGDAKQAAPATESTAATVAHGAGRIC
jgi:hypothetical protein